MNKINKEFYKLASKITKCLKEMNEYYYLKCFILNDNIETLVYSDNYTKSTYINKDLRFYVDQNSQVKILNVIDNLFENSLVCIKNKQYINLVERYLLLIDDIPTETVYSDFYKRNVRVITKESLTKYRDHIIAINIFGLVDATIINTCLKEKNFDQPTNIQLKNINPISINKNSDERFYNEIMNYYNYFLENKKNLFLSVYKKENN